MWAFRRRAALLLNPRTWWISVPWSALCCGAAALLISRRLSVPYALWDRHWHMPLVASLRGQLTPFQNVYEPGHPFFYHYSGNAFAAMLQALSFAHLHASAALARAHDVVFTLFGAFLGAALSVLGVRRSAHSVVLTTCMLLAGPATVLLEGLERRGTGWSYTNLLSLSFRPHEPLGYFFASALVLAGLGPFLLGAAHAWCQVLPALALFTAMLTLSDELTLGLAFGTVSVAWCLAPQSLVGGSIMRIAVPVSMLAALLATMLLFGGTFSPGAPKQAIELVSPRLPGFYAASMPLAKRESLLILGSDYLAPLAVGMCGVVAAVSKPNARNFLLLASFWSLLIVSLLILCVVEFNHDPTESHRAVTGLCLLAPLFLVLWLVRLPDGGARAWVLAVGGLACALCLASTVEWVRGVLPDAAVRFKPYWGDDKFYQTDCVALTGARLGERAMPSVGPMDRWNLFGGCRALFTPNGGQGGGHAIAVGWPDASASALPKMLPWLDTFPRVRVFFPRRVERNDAFVKKLSKVDRCVPAGREFVECQLDATAFRELAGH
jgi:hypothetical protein